MTARLELRQLFKAYIPGKPVLRGIDLTFEGAALTAIIGPGGAGKSTLIRCINRLVEPTSGAVLLDGVDLVALRGDALRQMRSRIGMVLNSAIDVFEWSSEAVVLLVILAVVIAAEVVATQLRKRLI